jgi:hypothetical protein
MLLPQFLQPYCNISHKTTHEFGKCDPCLTVHVPILEKKLWILTPGDASADRVIRSGGIASAPEPRQMISLHKHRSAQAWQG